MKNDIQDFVKTRPPLFWWLLLNILAITFAICSWVVCLNLFRDPTHPLSYELMYKVGRVPKLEAFLSKKSLPKISKTATAVEIDSLFRKFNNDEIAEFNKAVLREYLTNYHKSELLTCLIGDYTVISARPLDSDDFLSSGIVVRAQSTIQPEIDVPPVPYPVRVEIYYLGADFSKDTFLPGQLISLNKYEDCAALINVSQYDTKEGDSLFLSLVPLRAGPVSDAEKKVLYKISPPEKANLKAGFPAR